MKYEKNQYSEGVSFCSLIIAGAFIYWGVNEFRNGGSWIWPAILIVIGGSIALSQFYAVTNRGKLRNIVLTEFQRNPNATIEEICENTGISKKDVKAIILDLKAEGRLLGTFSTKTGQMEDIQIVSAPKSLKVPTPPMPSTSVDDRLSPTPLKSEESKHKFCANCGTRVYDTGAKYCQYCGFEI